MARAMDDQLMLLEAGVTHGVANVMVKDYAKRRDAERRIAARRKPEKPWWEQVMDMAH